MMRESYTSIGLTKPRFLPASSSHVAMTASSACSRYDRGLPNRERATRRACSALDPCARSSSSMGHWVRTSSRCHRCARSNTTFCACRFGVAVRLAKVHDRE
jgi:hypothetical protein